MLSISSIFLTNENFLIWCETTRNQWICHFIMTICDGWLSSYCCRWWGRGEACCSGTMVSMTTPCWGSLRVTNCPRISTSDKMEPEPIILLQVKKGIDAFQSARFKWIWNIWTLKILRLFKSLCFEKFVHIMTYLRSIILEKYLVWKKKYLI